MVFPNQEIKLSAREAEVLQLITEGLSNSRIANQLYVSPNTIKTHVRNLMNKLGVDCRIQLVVIAFQRGIIKVDP